MIRADSGWREQKDTNYGSLNEQNRHREYGRPQLVTALTGVGSPKSTGYPSIIQALHAVKDMRRFCRFTGSDKAYFPKRLL